MWVKTGCLILDVLMFYSTDISEIVTDHEHKVTMKNGVLFLIMRHYASDVLASQPPPPPFLAQPYLLINIIWWYQHQCTWLWFWCYRIQDLLKNTIFLTGFKETHEAFCRHQDEQLALYTTISIINLAELGGKEKEISDAYLNHIVEFNSPHITYTSFDFHEHWWVLIFCHIPQAVIFSIVNYKHSFITSNLC